MLLLICMLLYSLVLFIVYSIQINMDLEEPKSSIIEAIQ